MRMKIKSRVVCGIFCKRSKALVPFIVNILKSKIISRYILSYLKSMLRLFDLFFFFFHNIMFDISNMLIWYLDTYK